MSHIHPFSIQGYYSKIFLPSNNFIYKVQRKKLGNMKRLYRLSGCLFCVNCYDVSRAIQHTQLAQEDVASNTYSGHTSQQTRGNHPMLFQWADIKTALSESLLFAKMWLFFAISHKQARIFYGPLISKTNLSSLVLNKKKKYSYFKRSQLMEVIVIRVSSTTSSQWP